jgi:hypothetical protein
MFAGYRLAVFTPLFLFCQFSNYMKFFRGRINLILTWQSEGPGKFFEECPPSRHGMSQVVGDRHDVTR